MINDLSILTVRDTMCVEKDVTGGMKRTRRAVCNVREHVLSRAVLSNGSSGETVSFSSILSDPSAWQQQFTKYTVPANLCNRYKNLQSCLSRTLYRIRLHF